MSNWFEWRDAPPGDFAVLGDPIHHSRSPRIHAAAYAAYGLPLTYHAIRVPAGELAPALAHLESLRYRGVNVTLPLKEEAFAWAETEPRDAVYGSLNTLDIRTRFGTNTDVPAFLSTLRGFEIEPGALIHVLGAGGSAKALVVGLAQSGFRLRLWNRTQGKAEDLAQRTAALIPGAQIEVVAGVSPTDCAALINTTSTSLSAESLPIPWPSAPQNLLAYDIAYTDGLTRFQQEAAAHGLRHTDGRAMLVEQAALAFTWWTGKEAPRTDMLAAVYEHPHPHT